MVPAHVVEGAQRAVTSTHNDYGFSRKPRGNKFSRLVQLIRASDELPGSAEDVEPLHFCDARVDIPGRRDGPGFRQRGPVVVDGQNLLD